MLADWWHQKRGHRRDLSGAWRPGGPVWLHSGGQLFPMDPREFEIEIEDIAHALSNLCRYGGHSTGFYSVAEHSVIVSLFAERIARERHYQSDAVARHWGLQGLLHDASEAYIGDVTRPLKYHRSMRHYRKTEARLTVLIEKRFDLRPTKLSRSVIKECDNRIIIDETQVLMCEGIQREAIRKFRDSLDAEITCLPPHHAEDVFMQRFLDLHNVYETFTIA